MVDHLDFMGEVHVEARKDKWGIFFDGSYIDLSITGTVINHPYPSLGPLEGKLDLTEWIIELGGLYQVAQWRLEKGRAVHLDVLGGGRYWELEGDLTLSSPGAGSSFSLSGSEDWIDPFVGLRLGVDLGKNFLVGVRGDIGGFGVGSDVSWNASVLLGYRITGLLSVWVGYRALSVDYENGSGNDRFVYDVTKSGPMIGLGFRF
jgi:hypothetical protein